MPVNYPITSISKKKFLLASIIGTVLFLTSIQLIDIERAGILFNPLSILLIISAIILISHKIASQSTLITISERSIRIDEREILFEEISGYFINDTPFTMSSLELKLQTNEVVSVVAIKRGETGRRFKAMQKKFVESIEEKNSKAVVLTYGQIYVKDIRAGLIISYVMMGLVVLFDIYFLYMVYIGKLKFDVRILLANVFPILMILRTRSYRN